MIKKIREIIKSFREVGFTPERPFSLKGDSFARYSFAKKFCKGRSVLDVGTGFGLGARYLAENGAKKVLGIDYSRNAIRKARKHGLRNLKFRQMDARDLGQLDNKFGVIIAFEIIEHLPLENAHDFIDYLYERLAPRGILLLSTPNGLKSQYVGGRLYNPYHIKEYKKKEIKELVSNRFPSVKVVGYRMKDISLYKKTSEIPTTFFGKLIYIAGHFKIVREALSFIPQRIKQLVTKENELPLLTDKDYIFDKNYKDAYGLIVVAKNNLSRKNLSPAVSVVIANFNGQDYLRRCLDSVIASVYKKLEVIVCDDGSEDGSWDILNEYKRKYKFIKLLRNRKNLGASLSRNIAATKAKGNIIVFLDNDTTVDKNWLLEFVNVFVGDKRVGAAQALILDLDSIDLVQHAGGTLVPQAGLLIPFFQWRNYKDVKRELSRRSIIGVSAALAVRKEVFLKINGFDAKESIHSEDIDFCWRIWIAGYKVVLSEKSLVFHLSKSVERRASMKSSYYKVYFHLVKNSLRSFIKNYELVNIFRFLPEDVAINCLRAFLVVIRRFDFSALAATISALAWNIVNLSDTLKARREVNKERLLSDKYIMDKVFDKRNLIEIYNQEFRQTKLLW